MFVIPALDEDALVRMRAPPDPRNVFNGDEEDSADDVERSAPVGAFPGAKMDHGACSNYY